MRPSFVDGRPKHHSRGAYTHLQFTRKGKQAVVLSGSAVRFPNHLPLRDACYSRAVRWI